MRLAFRPFVRSLHRWTGLTAGLVVAFMALMGSGMVFRKQLEPIVDSALLSVPGCSGRVSLDALTSNASGAYPLGKLDYIRIFDPHVVEGRQPSTLIRFTDQTFVYLNPCNGEVLGTRDRYGGLFGVIERLHRLRFISNGGRIAGSSALLLALILVAGGLVLWWPSTRRGWRFAMTHDRKLPAAARRLRLHRTAGIYVAVIVLTSALTGLPQSFDWYRNGLYRIMGSPLPDHSAKSQSPAGAPLLSMEQAWQRTQALVPAPAEALLHFAQKPDDALDIYAIGRDAPHPNARSLITLDAHSGETLKFVPYAESSLGHRLYFWTLSVHTGYVGGILGQLLLLFGALGLPLLAYTGVRSYLRTLSPDTGAALRQVRVVGKRQEALNVCTFELADPSGRALDPFAAGAHIDVHVAEGIVRQYSLCNDPRETHRYQISVLRVAESRGGSHAMHDDVQVGDTLGISEPRNHFPLAHAAGHSLLLAAGIGITPILCMAERLSNIGADFTLHYWARSRGHAAFYERIRRSPFADRVSFHFSDGAEEKRPEIGDLLPDAATDTHIYVCGPTRFLDAALQAAERKGFRDASVHREYFGAALQSTDEDRPFTIRIASSGHAFLVEKGVTALAALEKAGIVVPRSCEQGVCGTCITAVLEGIPDHRDRVLTAAERCGNDRFTPCCSRSITDTLTLDL